jgi:hypothetical protein
LKQIKATVLGFIAATIVPAAYIAVSFPLSAERNLQAILLSFIVFYFFTVSAAIILGIPGFLVLKKFKLIRWWSAFAYGALVGASSLAALISNVSANSEAISRNAVLGGIAGLVFWFFWRIGQINEN